MRLKSFTFRDNINLFIHVSVWMIFAYVLFFQYLFTCDCNPPSFFWLKQFLLLISLIFLFYFHLKYIIPRWLLNKNYGPYILITTTLLFTHLMYSRVVDRLILRISKGIYANIDMSSLDMILQQVNPFVGRAYYDKMMPIIDLLLVAIGIIIAFSKNWQVEQKRMQELEQERISAELTYLKAQINPHFFFNTLNNIYSYTLIDGDIARNAISNLSKMMRYVLYDSQNQQTTLEKEISFITEYIGLMKLRLTNNVKIDTLFETENPKVSLAPMIFLPFVENAFKHGISTIENCFIQLTLQQSFDKIQFEISNSKVNSQSPSLEKSNGIGLVNTKRRLDLLYPNQYDLKIDDSDENVYKVSLTIYTP